MTWSNSPTVTLKWIILNNNCSLGQCAPVNTATGSTYTLAAGDLAHGTGTSIYLEEIASNAAGVNVSDSNGVTLNWFGLMPLAAFRRRRKPANDNVLGGEARAAA